MAPDPLARRLVGLSWPHPTVDRPAPEAGQLWRVTWGQVAALVVIVGSPRNRRVPVAMASSDPVGDATAFVAETNVGLQPTVWADLRGQIGTFTLDRRLADLATSSAVQLGLSRPPSASQWAAIVDPLDDRALLRARLADTLATLEEIEWLPGRRPGEALGVLVGRAGLSVSELAVQLDITPGDARRLLLGRREPTTAELSALTELLGAAPGGVVEYDADLVADLDQPAGRPHVQRWAARHNVTDELTARRQLAGAVLATAARHRESTARRNWAALIAEAADAD